MKSLALLLLTLPSIAQPIAILCGSTADQYFTGGVAWQMPTTLAPALQALRYAPSFQYNIPLTNGLYNVAVVIVEPNATAPLQRRFTITANGQQTAPVDVFALTGAINVPTTVNLQALVGAGFLRIQFAATIGNAIVSEIITTPIASGLGGTVPISGMAPQSLYITADGVNGTLVLIAGAPPVAAKVFLVPNPDGSLTPQYAYSAAGSFMQDVFGTPGAALFSTLAPLYPAAPPNAAIWQQLAWR
jgi:hypothetical protein